MPAVDIIVWLHISCIFNKDLMFTCFILIRVFILCVSLEGCIYFCYCVSKSKMFMIYLVSYYKLEITPLEWLSALAHKFMECTLAGGV